MICNNQLPSVNYRNSLFKTGLWSSFSSVSGVDWRMSRGISLLCCRCFGRKTVNVSMISLVSRRSVFYLPFVLFLKNLLFWLSVTLFLFLLQSKWFSIVDRRTCPLRRRCFSAWNFWSQIHKLYLNPKNGLKATIPYCFHRCQMAVTSSFKEKNPVMST